MSQPPPLPISRPQVANFCIKCATAFGTANYCPNCGYCRYTNFIPQVYIQQPQQGRSGIGFFVLIPIGLIFAVISSLFSHC
jgi:hypothetical protein